MLFVKKLANAFKILFIASLILLQHSCSQGDPAYWDTPFEKPQYMVHSSDARNVQSWSISDAPEDWASGGIIEILGPYNTPRQLCDCMAASGKVNMETFNIISCSLMPTQPGETKLPTVCPQGGPGTDTQTGPGAGTPTGQTEGSSNLVLVKNQVKTGISPGEKFTLSPQDKLELKANCDKIVDLFRANMGKDKNLEAVIRIIALSIAINIPTELGPTCALAHKVTVVCGKLYSGGYDLPPAKQFVSESPSELLLKSNYIWKMGPWSWR
jgi:hypothetical protein